MTSVAIDQQALQSSRVSSHDARAVPRVCIIVLNWNGWQDTIDCLASLQNLNYANHEILTIDNGSTNDSVRRINERFPKIPITRLERNLGFSGGCNVGIRHALASGAQYVWLLNNDTKVEPRTLEAMVEVAEKDPRVGAVGSVLYDMHNPDRVQAWGGGKVNLWFGRSSLCAEQTPEDELSYVTGASLMLRKQSIEQVGLFDEAFFMYWEDVDLCFRLRKAGWKLAVARDSQVWHKESASVDTKRIAFDRYLWTSTVHFCDRHAPLSLIPKVVATARMVAKRILRFQWMRAARLCRTVAVHSRNGAPKLIEIDGRGAMSGEEQ